MVTNDIVTDQRVERSCNILHEMGVEVLLIGRKLHNSLPVTRKYKIKRMRLIFNKKAIFYAEYNLRLFFYLLFHKADLYIANDLDVLLANTTAAKIKHVPIIFDSHEYFCGMPELVNRRHIRNFWKRIEKHCIPKVQTMITVNKSIANLFQKEYNIDVHVVRNVPYKYSIKNTDTVRQDIKDIMPYIIYQGAINIQRGLEEMIEAMQFIDGYHFIIAGEGDILNILKKHVSTLPWKDKIIFLGRLSPENLKHYTVNATLGVSLENDCCINYHYGLPNKFFDYINANIPVLVSNLVEMANIVTTYHIGDIIISHKPKDLASQINKMLNNKELLQYYKNNTIIAADNLCWEKESETLKKIYQQYINIHI